MRVFRHSFRPCLCSPGSGPGGQGAGWIIEKKYDGVRCTAFISNGCVELVGRSGKLVTRKAGGTVEALEKLPDSVIDGELVAEPSGPVFYAFDLIEVNGLDARDLPLMDRKLRLAKLIGLLTDPGPVKVAQTWPSSDAVAVLNKANEEAWEGLVFKEAASKYTAGRTDRWVKLKIRREQEFAVLGWTNGGGPRGTGALLLGVRNLTGGWDYCGRVGTGGGAFMWDVIKQSSLISEAACAAVASENPRAIYCEPKVVVQVAFQKFTFPGPRGRLWHPSLKGIRKDKSADTVYRDTYMNESSDWKTK